MHTRLILQIVSKSFDAVLCRHLQSTCILLMPFSEQETRMNKYIINLVKDCDIYQKLKAWNWPGICYLPTYIYFSYPCITLLGGILCFCHHNYAVSTHAIFIVIQIIKESY